MSDLGRTEFTRDELLADAPVSAPLYAGKVLCHGGFDADGAYVSPRALHRAPAIAAWQHALRSAGTPLVTISDAHVPPQFPSLEQARLLLRNGVREPLVRALTLISVVEGFGAVIRETPVPPLAALCVEPIAGTCLAHLDRGLFEAHARDEAGYGEQGGHKQMWEAARDLALESPPVPADVLARLFGARARERPRPPAFPELDPRLTRMVGTLCQVLVVESFARRTFDWGEALLADPELSAEPARAGAMVRHIRADETPHVEYLRTALSELRARTLRTVDGRTLSGAEVVDRLLGEVLAAVAARRQEELRADVRAGVVRAVERGHAQRGLLEEFDHLSPVYTPPATSGFTAEAAG